MLSWEEAQSRDFDEAVVLNERGEIVSATTANLFWAKNGTLHTPALSTGALAGIARECVIEIANKHFVPLLEGNYEMQDLTDADEIFLTSSSLGVAPVTTFDFRRYSVEGPLTRQLQQAFREQQMTQIKSGFHLRHPRFNPSALVATISAAYLSHRRSRCRPLAPSPTIGVSPAPADGRSFRSTNTISIFGMSLNRGTR